MAKVQKCYLKIQEDIRARHKNSVVGHPLHAPKISECNILFFHFLTIKIS